MIATVEFVVPAQGSFLTDGARLLEVRRVTERGLFCEDALDVSSRSFLTHEEATKWRLLDYHSDSDA